MAGIYASRVSKVNKKGEKKKTVKVTGKKGSVKMTKETPYGSRKSKVKIKTIY